MPLVTLDDRVEFPEDVIAQQVGEEMVLLDLELAPAGSDDAGADDGAATDLRPLAASLKELAALHGVEAFDRMRELFDDAFYRVDKRTLRAVERAHERAVGLAQWLDGLGVAEAAVTV